MASEVGNVNLQERVKYFKKKRILFLFFIYALVIIAILPPLIVYFVTDTFEIWASIFLIVLFAAFGLIIWMRQKVSFYNMHYQYYKMLVNNVGILNLEQKIYNSAWLKKITSLGFDLAYEDNEINIFRKYVKRDKLGAYISQTELLIMISKKPGVDLFANYIQDKIDHVKRDPKDKIRRLVVLQFEKHPNYDAALINDLNQIINIKNGKMFQVHLSLGYFEDTNQLYFLQPLKKYPNKYYFVAKSLVYQVCHIKGDKHE